MLILPGELSKAQWRWPVKDSSCTMHFCSCTELPCWFCACVPRWYWHREGAWGTGNLTGSPVCSWGLLDAKTLPRHAGIKWGSKDIAFLFRFYSMYNLLGLESLWLCFLRTAQPFINHHNTPVSQVSFSSKRELASYCQTVFTKNGDEKQQISLLICLSSF